MPKKKYIVSLTLSEPQALSQLTPSGKAAAYKLNHARILLKADINQDNGGWTDYKISEALDISQATLIASTQTFRLSRSRSRMESRQPRTQHKKRRLDGEKEAHLIALACSEPPPGLCTLDNETIS